MKHRTTLAILAVLVLSLVHTTAGANLKLGFIDSDVLKDRLPEFQEAQRQLDERRQQFEREATERERRLLRMREDFRKQELLMSEARKAELQADFDAQVRELQEYTEMKFGPEGELMRLNMQLSSPIFEKINSALMKLAEERDFDFIFDAAAPGTGLVFAKDQYDVTEELLDLLEEQREHAASPGP